MLTLHGWMARNPIKRLRDEQQLNRAQFAALVGVSVTAVANWEAGTNISEEKLADIASVFGTPFKKKYQNWRDGRPEAA